MNRKKEENSPATKKPIFSVEALRPSVPPPAALLRLPQSVREQIRSVSGLHIPSEKKTIKSKIQMADTHGTRTSTFAHGAYLTDPLRFVRAVCVQSPLLVVGGDAGGGHTKIGITCTVENIQQFAPLLVYDGKDDWEQLHRLEASGMTTFEGDSASFPHIFAFLQHLIDDYQAFLNGGWSFINTILGLKCASSSHPCPICIVSSSSLLRAARYRTAKDKHSMHPQQHPFLHILPERIVPTPLHVFLGISNRIIL